MVFEEAPNWWHRLEIIYNKQQDVLRYYAFTDRARVEESLVAGDMRNADDFVRDAVASTRDDPAVAKTLFEMLVPNRLKQQAPDQRDLVLVVDDDEVQVGTVGEVQHPVDGLLQQVEPIAMSKVGRN